MTSSLTDVRAEIESAEDELRQVLRMFLLSEVVEAGRLVPPQFEQLKAALGQVLDERPSPDWRADLQRELDGLSERLSAHLDAQVAGIQARSGLSAGELELRLEALELKQSGSLARLEGVETNLSTLTDAVQDVQQLLEAGYARPPEPPPPAQPPPLAESYQPSVRPAEATESAPGSTWERYLTRVFGKRLWLGVLAVVLAGVVAVVAFVRPLTSTNSTISADAPASDASRAAAVRQGALALQSRLAKIEGDLAASGGQGAGPTDEATRLAADGRSLETDLVRLRSDAILATLPDRTPLNGLMDTDPSRLEAQLRSDQDRLARLQGRVAALILAHAQLAAIEPLVETQQRNVSAALAAWRPSKSRQDDQTKSTLAAYGADLAKAEGAARDVPDALNKLGMLRQIAAGLNDLGPPLQSQSELDKANHASQVHGGVARKAPPHPASRKEGAATISDAPAVAPGATGRDTQP